MPTLSVNFSDEDYRILVRAKAVIVGERGVELNWHDALLRLAKSYIDNAKPSFLALKRKRRP